MPSESSHVRERSTYPLNAVYSSRHMKRRYEVWFLRCGLADGRGAWWFRYLLLNPAASYSNPEPAEMPVQTWATWFPREGKPQTFIEGFPFGLAQISRPRQLPFFLRVAECGIEHDACWGNLRVDGHAISWKLRYRSNFGITLSDKGWIGFSKSPHSNAQFSGEITFDGQTFSGDSLAFGVQGHNCGYRHRTYWRWMHAYFRDSRGNPSTLEALVYDLPFGMVFCKAVWWHNGKPAVLRRIQEKDMVNERDHLRWAFDAETSDGAPINVLVEAAAPGIHHLPYVKTDCSGTFPVANASLACARVSFGAGANQSIATDTGAALEFGGSQP